MVWFFPTIFLDCFALPQNYIIHLLSQNDSFPLSVGSFLRSTSCPTRSGLRPNQAGIIGTRGNSVLIPPDHVGYSLMIYIDCARGIPSGLSRYARPT
jgi:hypothetical protein